MGFDGKVEPSPSTCSLPRSFQHASDPPDFSYDSHAKPGAFNAADVWKNAPVKMIQNMRLEFLEMPMPVSVIAISVIHQPSVHQAPGGGHRSRPALGGIFDRIAQNIQYNFDIYVVSM